jgi:hypothetical protein
LEENEPGWKLSSENEVEEDDFYGHLYGGVPTPPAAVAANRKSAGQPASSIHPMGANGEFSSGNRAFRRHHPDSSARSYRDFYYETKLGWPAADREATLFRRRAHVRDFLEGLHWVLNYYHNGCPSWDWYFPHLYSPLCTDMVNLDEFYEENDEEYKAFPFEQTTPFPSLAQLLSVLPPQSADLLPEPIAELMIHPSSPLMSYYPQDFTVDPNGKRQSWEAIVQIPFIDADVLLETVEQVIQADEKAEDENKLFTNAERRRNVRGTSHKFAAPHRTGEVPREERIVMEQAPVSRGGQRGTSKWGRNDQAGAGAQRSPKGAVEAGAPRRRRSPKGSSRNDLK